MRKRSGFTLIELLVVIAIISVLAALLLPTLHMGITKARGIQCQNEIKQWVIAFILYTQENEDRLPREGYERFGEVEWNNWAQVGMARDAWYNGLSNYVARPPASYYAVTGNYSDFYKHSSFFHCPSTRFPDDAKNPIFPIALFSRAMNSQLIQYPEVPTIKITSITHPSKTALFLDNRLKNEIKVCPAQLDSFLGQPSAHANRFAGRRHGKTGNIGFVDGHVSSMKGEDVVSADGWYTKVVKWDAHPQPEPGN